MINITKCCIHCKQHKLTKCFYKHPKTKDGFDSKCKECAKNQVYKQKIDNPVKYKDLAKKHRNDNKEYYQNYMKKYFKDNPNYQKEYWEKNPQLRNKYNKIKQQDPLYKIHYSVFNGIKRGMKKINHIKNQSSLEILGLESWDKFREHIESLWVEGMSWENYGRNYKTDWSIDHNIPISSAKTEEEVKTLNHYTNLRPMWHLDNVKKSNK